MLFSAQFGDLRTYQNTVLYGSVLSEVLQRFWESEEPPTADRQKPEDDECELFYQYNTARCPSGRFVTRLPFLPNRPALASSTGTVHVRLVMAKSKVAPVRTRWTIPKLELAGAALLARLLNHVTCNLRGTINLDETVYAWTDSRIVLCWLQTSVHTLEVFVANRVSQITGSETPLVWRHVPGEWNPADCASRGCRAPDLVSHPLWWGPQWLTESPQEWPFNECRAPLGPPDRGLRVNVGQLVPKPNPAFLLERYSSLDKLLGVTGWIKRFVNNCRKPQAERNFAPVLSPAERNAALCSLVRVVQAEHFEEEVRLLRDGLLTSVCKRFSYLSTRMFLTLILGLVTLAVALYFYFKNVFSRFEKKGVKTGKMYAKRIHMAYSQRELYNTFPTERFVGYFEFTTPKVQIRDMELVKNITIKDFQHFVDHQFYLDAEVNPLVGNGLFFMRGQQWKDMRTIMSPTFTGSKIRMMIPFMKEVADQMLVNLKKKINSSESGQIEVDVKDLMARYACDVIASCAFGLKVDSLTDRDNEFFIKGIKASDFKFREILIFMMSAHLNWVVRLFNLKLYDESLENFYRSIVLSTMEEREKLNIHRPDMINILLEAKKGKLQREEKTTDGNDGFANVKEFSVSGKNNDSREWNDDELVAQAVTFLQAGFETTSTTMSFLLYELALNPEVQDRLAEEIREVSAKHGGKIDFNTIQELTYLDMVVSETMRKWPAVQFVDRRCVKDYNLGKPNPQATEDFIVRKGEGVLIPTFSIHYDPQYFPDPNKFDPERWSETNKHQINPFSYSPFGLGPRTCLGSRFALYEMKVMAYQLLQHMELSPSARTTIPAELEPSTFQLWLKGGTHLNFKIRT
ncbi:cytochrome p450 domain-containing protein [Phthorimaea operculella]|nr:cytochrome p450 domain-containing protein [Phthorimaea operculella]